MSPDPESPPACKVGELGRLTDLSCFAALIRKLDYVGQSRPAHVQSAGVAHLAEEN